jgi:hypothetical protein
MRLDLLYNLGFDYDVDDFTLKPITLRDGDEATLWFHEPTGHGILASEFWVQDDFYSQQYRDVQSLLIKRYKVLGDWMCSWWNRIKG